MVDTRTIRICAASIVGAYAALVFALLGGIKLYELAAWDVSPLLPPLFIAFVGANKKLQWAALTLLFGLAIAGAILLSWGLVWNPGDYNHLVVIFLPIYQFGVVALALVGFGIVALVRRVTA